MDYTELHGVSVQQVVVIVGITICMHEYLLPKLEVTSLGDAGRVLGTNLALFLAFYSIPSLLLFKFKVSKEDKFTKDKYTAPQAMFREFLATMSTWSIGMCFDLAVRYAAGRGLVRIQQETFDALSGVLINVLALIVWTDLHFYFTHRMLHLPWFFNKFHYLHHQSYNPNPWSSLSFHPVEAIIYYSSILGIFLLPSPSTFAFAITKAIVDFSPLFGHVGFGGKWGGNRHHWLHHVHKNWNYGGTPLSDRIFGTLLFIDYSVDKDATKARPK